MNHEFEWRKQLRKLGGDVEPSRDLWPDIGARIAAAGRTPARPARAHRGAWLALAATVIVAVGAGLVWRSHAPTAPAHIAAAAPNTTPVTAPPATAPVATAPMATASVASDAPRTALDWAVPADPALAASAQNLDDASAQLQDALEQRPDAVFLVGLLNRTNAMRLRLMRKSPYSG
jgi:hypothetical protein